MARCHRGLYPTCRSSKQANTIQPMRLLVFCLKSDRNNNGKKGLLYRVVWPYARMQSSAMEFSKLSHVAGQMWLIYHPILGKNMLVLCETWETWTGFILSARFSLDVNPWWPFSKDNCQNCTGVTNSLTQHTQLGYLYWAEVVLNEFAEL